MTITTPRTTRSTSQSLLKNALKELQFTEEEIEYIMVKKGFRTTTSILNAYEGNRILNLTCDSLPEGPCETLSRFGAYLKWRTTVDGDLRVLDNFDPTIFESFDPKILNAGTKPTVVSSHEPTTKIKLSEFPKFNGKSSEWNRFYETFTAAANIYGIGYLLKERADHESRFSTDTKYTEDCKVLFSVLKYVCASGTALPRVNTYNDTEDGYKAFRSLYEHNYAKGNIEEYGNACLEELMGLRLTYNSAGGMEAYLSKFEKLVLELQNIDPSWNHRRRPCS